MAYIINRFDGTQLAIIEDGQLDTSTPIGLIGRNYTGYGEVQNENLVYILENFANVSPPTRALRGQAWYDTQNKSLKIYNGDEWLNIGNATVNDVEPEHSVGGLWLKNSTQQLYISDGTVWRLVGPEGVEGFGVTKLTSTKIKDVAGTFRPVILAQINGETTAIITAVDFQISGENPIDGFSRLFKGINLKPGFDFIGTLKGSAESAAKLTTARKINNVNFDGTQDITITASTTRQLKSGEFIIGSDFDGSFEAEWDIDATPQNFPGKIVSRDSTGGFSASTITADLFGNVTGNVTATSGFSSFNEIRVDTVVGNTFSGIANRALRLNTVRTINGVNFDGTANITIPINSNELVGNRLANNVVESSLRSLGKLVSLDIEPIGVQIGDGNDMSVFVDGFTPTIQADTTDILRFRLLTGSSSNTPTTVTFVNHTAGEGSPALVPDYNLGTAIDNRPSLGTSTNKWKNVFAKNLNVENTYTTNLNGPGNQVIVSNNLVVQGTTYGNLTGNVTGTLTGTVIGSLTGAASLNMLKTGDSMAGNLRFDFSGNGITWDMNTDGASIKFYNTSDGDADSRLEFNTKDNTNEYFRWTHTVGGSTYESMRLMPNTTGGAELTVSGNVSVTGNITLPNSSSTFQGRGSGITDLNAFNLSTGTVPTGRLSGTYTINIAGNASTVSSITSPQVVTALGYTPSNRAGDTLTGDITWNTTGRGIVWGMNSDGASIKFYNTGDGDANSRLEFQTSDNGNEYFSWTHLPSGGSVFESMRLTPNSSGNANLTVNGSVNITGNVTASGSYSGVGTNLDINADRLITGTIPLGRLSGTYNISISGNANTANTANIATANIQRTGDTMTGRLGQHTLGFHAATIQNITARTNSGFFDTDSATTAEGWPVTTNTWYHLLSSTHVNDANYYAMQFAGDFYSQNVYYRSTGGNGSTAWNRLIHSNNFTDYAPSKTGSGASGTWPINISGQAASVASITSSQISNALGFTPANAATVASALSGTISADTATFTGPLTIAAGSTNGIRFPNDAYGGGGDTARITLETAGGEATRMRFTVTNDADDMIEFNVPTISGVKINSWTVLNDGNFTATYGNTQYSTTGFTNQVGSWNNGANYFDVFPPAGYTMSHLVAFIPSIAVIHYAGGVNGDDSMRCTWSNLGDRVRVYVQNTEQRSTPAANWLALWRK